MKIKFAWFVFILLNFYSVCLLAENKNYSEYYLIRRNYENFAENDPKALPFIKQYINRSKNEKEYSKLFQGYSDAVRYSPLPSDKLKYADSTIIVAKLSHDDQLISEAYLEKGVVYYFQFKKYKLALDEYLKACKYLREGSDPYHRNRLVYLIGVVKSYIGFYNESLVNFKQTSAFFENESKKVMHPNIIYGYKRGYFNSMHQMIVCYRNLGNFKKADSLINIGLQSTFNNNEYNQEYGYFLKERGIELFRKKQFKEAIIALKSSLQSISSVNDFAWATVCYSYIGKSFLDLDQKNQAKNYFEKVDSVFQARGFILPEVRSSYELLIKYYKKENNSKKELYYTTELLKADNFISQDFTYLSSKIHREFDTKRLNEEKQRLDRNSVISKWINISFGLIAITGVIIAMIWYIENKKIKKSYDLLTQKIIREESKNSISDITKVKDIQSVGIDPKIVESLASKLDNFEKKIGYIEHGLTLNKLAKKFDTNTFYLSQVINDLKGMNFNKYLGELRIRYITGKLYNDRKYLNYKIETLADECGIASRSNFSNLFQEINGIRPTDFIKERQKELESEKKQLSHEIE
ncbi:MULTISPECIES: helix-turn-helix domain-containing protein [Sphingobacterium]|uniref:helix-turn-helix domain-containing protein n=1 Tax=Sphingobacterium TaxID=28453 RepID=UPI00257C7D3C|nr:MULTISPECIES: helix-turn-helix domain-containing protein [Sphingobacterium]